MPHFLQPSTKSHYGLILMTRIAENKNSPLSLAEIGKTELISAGYLEQLVLPLKKARLVISQRGAKGGYKLAKPAKKITVREIIETLEGSLTMVQCLDKKGERCPIDGRCHSKNLWATVQGKVHKTLENITLDDLIKKSS